MTIRAKLTLNVIIVLVIIAAVVATSIIGMGFIKSRLLYLTEQSTPYQIRTMDLQRSLQSATADLVKVSFSRDGDEYRRNQAEAEKTLSDVKSIQEKLEVFSAGGGAEIYDDLRKTSTELFEATEKRLKAEADVSAANNIILQKLSDTSNKLKELDSKIKSLQAYRSKTFLASKEDTQKISSGLRSMELFRAMLKDIQVAFFEMQKARDKKSLIIARGLHNSAISRAGQNEYVRDSGELSGQLKTLSEKMEELSKIQLSVVNEADGETKSRYDALTKDIGAQLWNILLPLDSEINAANEKYDMENRKQGDVFSESNIATSVLIKNSEMLAYGLSIEGLTTKLFTTDSSKEVDNVEWEIKRIYEKLGSVQKSLEDALAQLNAKDELKILRGVSESLSYVKGVLFADEGAISKVHNKLAMDERAAKATERLREIVLKQTEKSKVTVTAAQGEQEKSIGTVNSMVRFSTILIGIISVVAVVFGISFGVWVYRSITNPLTGLIAVSDEVANGNLRSEIYVQSVDEIGIVQSSMAKMVSNLHGIVGQIRTATGGLADSSEALLSTATELEKGSHALSLQTAQSSAAMTEMSHSIIDVTKNASDAAGTSKRTAELARKGKESVGHTVQGMMKIASVVNEASESVESLGKSSKEIGNVVNVIKEIADQINLLALNAAIEAARAGEQGRGFAVVADEVRHLAEKTVGSTQEIGAIITKIQNAVLKSVNVMKHGKTEVEAGVRLAESAKSSLDMIVSASEKESDMIHMIAASSEQQSATTEQVSVSVESIAQVTKEFGDSVTKIKRASDALSRHAADLNAMASWFKA